MIHVNDEWCQTICTGCWSLTEKIERTVCSKCGAPVAVAHVPDTLPNPEDRLITDVFALIDSKAAKDSLRYAMSKGEYLENLDE